MVAISTPERFGNKWMVSLQCDSAGTMPQSGADVENLKGMVSANDPVEFFSGSMLRVLTPFALYFYGEDGQWHEAG